MESAMENNKIIQDIWQLTNFHHRLETPVGS